MHSFDWSRILSEEEIRHHEPMAGHTTFRCGGEAEWLLTPENLEKMAEILRVCHENGTKPFFLGNGSNLLVGDEGYAGVMVSTRNLVELGRVKADTEAVVADAEAVRADAEEVKTDAEAVVADAGVLLPRLAGFAAEESLTGLEFAAGIPGSVGGGVRMNAGAYGGELAQVIRWVEYLDELGQLHRLEKEECQFRYRHSIFCEKPWLVVRAGLTLKRGNGLTIRQRMAELNQQRREKQPLEYPSAGSAFKRPEGHFAAALIDQCGLKGFAVGGAQVSEKHAGFVINRSGATAGDIKTLMAEVIRRVKEQTGVTLEPEVEIIPKEG